MYELIQVGASTYYIDCPVRMGLIHVPEGAVMIDGGSDKDAGKKALRHVEALRFPLMAILCTHSHADHIGGCRLLAERTGAPVYLPDGEVAFGRTPELEGAMLYGAAAPAPLRNKFLLAPEFDARPLTNFVLPAGMEVRSLPGHSPDMTAYRSPDGVWFLGDAVFGDATLEKYHISYLYDVAKTLASFEEVMTLEGTRFVPAHSSEQMDIRPLTERNRTVLHEVLETIATLCTPGITFEELLKGVFLRYGLTMDLSQYVLIGSTVKAVLTYLSDQGRVSITAENSRIIWRAN